ncbi:GINS complex Psf1 component [Russula ochroleuca]|jgi:GINS complex subunit 1|uniref:DNA replication complex GINS protein PSF1 n=1 Tax=Russula ochroleuca TaxID=152965 RepID=A0A9P5JYG5_9AGAM|nr:GINS complex Psf1 component [Russula ochroleuca]
MASSDSRQYGDLATQLVQESRRSTLTDTLLKYNDTLVRTIIREQRNLEDLINSAIAAQADSAALTTTDAPALLLYQTAILRNKRCLLAYHAHRLDRLKDMYWALGGALPALLADNELRSRMSPHEVDFLREYNTSIMDFRGDFSAELDIAASITHPPRDLHALVRVVRDCGVIETELGTIDFRKGQRFMVRRADIEHLIVQGYLEEV